MSKLIFAYENCHFNSENDIWILKLLFEFEVLNLNF